MSASGKALAKPAPCFSVLFLQHFVVLSPPLPWMSPQQIPLFLEAHLVYLLLLGSSKQGQMTVVQYLIFLPVSQDIFDYRPLISPMSCNSSNGNVSLISSATLQISLYQMLLVATGCLLSCTHSRTKQHNNAIILDQTCQCEACLLPLINFEKLQKLAIYLSTAEISFYT